MRITDFTELTTPTSNDLLVVVDVVNDITKKLKLSSLPVSTSVTTALATKQDTLVSGTNIKTVNSITLLGSGDIVVQTPLVSGTSIKTVNSNSLLGAGDIAVQPTLVSGTNIKTINSTSLLGSGNITIAASPSGVAGAIQFSDGSAFASDVSNFFWDDTNNRLGIGTNAPSSKLEIMGGSTGSTFSVKIKNSTGTPLLQIRDDGQIQIGNGVGNINTVNGVSDLPQINAYTSIYTGINTKNASARMECDSTTQGFLPPRMTTTQRDAIVTPATGLKVYNTTTNTTDTYDGATWQRFGQQTLIKGSGSTSATTSLLVQNSAGSSALQVTDDRIVKTFNGLDLSGNILYANGVGNASIFGGTSWLFDTAATGTFRFRNGSMALGASVADATAHLDVQSTTKGFLPPRMTTTQKNAIASPAAGLVVYDTTTNKLCCYNGSTWNDLF